MDTSSAGGNRSVCTSSAVAQPHHPKGPIHISTVCLSKSWEFPNLVVCNFYAEALFLRSFAPFCRLMSALICALFRVATSDRVYNDRVWELQQRADFTEKGGSLLLVMGRMLFGEHCNNFGRKNAVSSEAILVSSASNSVSSLWHTNNRLRGTH